VPYEKVGIFLPGGVTVDFKHLEKDDEIYVAFDGGEWQPPLEAAAACDVYHQSVPKNLSPCLAPMNARRLGRVSPELSTPDFCFLYEQECKPSSVIARGDALLL
jgi:hypothetical protein